MEFDLLGFIEDEKECLLVVINCVVELVCIVGCIFKLGMVNLEVVDVGV